MKDSRVHLVIVLCGLVTCSFGLPTTFDCKPSGTCDESTWNLAFIDKNAVLYVNFSTNSSISYIFQNDDHRPNFLTTNVRGNIVYWTDIDANGHPVVYRSSLNSTNSTGIFVDAGIHDPQGLAYDWIGGNIYFLDNRLTSHQIIVCPTTKLTRCAVIFQEESGNPYDIALNPNEGLMFWTVNGINPYIKRAQMDGTLPTNLITTDIQHPKAICVDENRIFWTDVKKQVIESARYDGTDRQVIVKSVMSSFGIGILGDFLIWADQNGSKLQKLNKQNGHNVSRIMPEFLSGELTLDIKSINVIHESNQQKSRTDSCKNKGCSHICVMSGSNDTRCLCPVEMKINGTSCQVDSNKPSLFVAQKTTLLMTQVDIIGTDVFQKLPLPRTVKTIDALVYNPISKSVIIYDGISKKIFNYSHETNVLDVLVDENLFHVVSMDLDLISHNLFWLDTGKNEVEIFSLQSRTRRVVYKNVQNGHQVVSDLGSIYVAKTGSTGIQEIHLVHLRHPTSDKMVKTFGVDFWPVQMTHDKSTTMLVIASSNDRHVTIESEYMAYRKDVAFSLTLNGGPVEALTKLANRVYWLDQSNKVTVLTPGDVLDGKYLLERITVNDDKISNKTRKLIAVHPGSVYLEQLMENLHLHVCTHESNWCSEICIPDSDMSGRCWCQNGYEMSDGSHGKCVESDLITSTARSFEYEDMIVEASDFVGDAIDGHSNGVTSGVVWGYLVMSFVIVFLGCIIAYMGWRWRETRSIPLIIKPFVRNEE